MKNLFLILCCSYGCIAAGQTAKRPFTFGMSTSFEFPLTAHDVFTQKPPLSFEPVRLDRARPGGGIGLFGRWPINASVAYQQELLLTFSSQTIIFQEKDQEAEPVDFQFNELELPVHFVFTNNRRADTPLSGCITLGARLGWNMYRNDDKAITLLRERIALDAGLGMEIRLRSWRIQPELLYSHALNNQHDAQNGRFDPLVGRLLRDRVTLRLLVWLRN